MGCKSSKVNPVSESAIRRVDNSIEGRSHVQQNIGLDQAAAINKLKGAINNVETQVADPQAFNNTLIQQRQQAIDNRSYRSAIDSWQPRSLQQLAETIKAFSKGKSVVDRHWMIFYWIACNIGYDTVSYFSGKFDDQSAEGVFRTRKGVCAGYANLYKYLCDQLEMTCEIISGYAKGYGFDNREEAPSKTDHAWNAVEIDNHWYLMESTWGAGYLNEQKIFVRKLKTYYFLPRPNEMIYDHLPEDEKWQLLRTPINMTQYMQMPKLRSTYFELNLELISPRNQANVDFLPDKPYALVLIRAPSDVRLIADLKLNNEEIDGGHRVVFDDQEQLYCCYFAPSTIGKHKITIYGKQHSTKNDNYHQALDLTFNVKQMPPNRMSFPETWEEFFVLGLEVVSPPNTHLIKLSNGVNHVEIQIRTPEHVQLIGRLENEQKEKVVGGDRVYYDRENNIWRCQFAPDQDGHFNALIMSKKKSDPGSYTATVAFKIDAKQIPSPPISYPHTWQPFYELDLKIEAPKNRANAIWPENASYAEVLIQAPDDVILSCDIKYNDVKIENGSLAQFDHEKKLWQLLFAPEQTGPHELLIFAQRRDDTKSSSAAVVKFDLDVTKLRRPMKFPLIYTQFQSKKCRIYTPMDGILKKNSAVSIHCFVPGAKDVNLTVDSKWLVNEGYADPTLQRQITVGSKEVIIYAKYGEKAEYDGLVKYSVQ
jgi:hypothetical protein